MRAEGEDISMAGKKDKSCWLASFTLLLMLVPVSAQSVGIGGSWLPTFEQDLLTFNGVSNSYSTDSSMFKCKAFVDAVYVEASFGFAANIRYYSTIDNGDSTSYSDGDVGTWLTFCVMGKYPIQLGGLAFFPLLGLEYDADLTYAKTGGGTPAVSAGSDYDQWWIKGGVGADIPLSEPVFLRPEVLLGYKFNSGLERDKIAADERNAAASGNTLYESLTWIGIEVSVSVGYRFD
jgi:hypothetical protein